MHHHLTIQTTQSLFLSRAIENLFDRTDNAIRISHCNTVNNFRFYNQQWYVWITVSFLQHPFFYDETFFISSASATSLKKTYTIPKPTDIMIFLLCI